MKPKAEAIFELRAEILQRGNPLRFTARGSSMYPLIREGDTIVVEPVRISQVRVGDVLFYRTAMGTVAHRLVATRKEKGGTALLCQGDTSTRPGPPVRADELLGRVVAVSRNGGKSRLDAYGNRLLGLAVAKSAPLRSLAYPVAKGTRRIVRRLLSKAEPSAVEKLLLLCARTEPDGETTRRMSALCREKIDWEELIAQTIRHGTAPNVYRHLQEIDNSVPGWVRERLYKIYLGNLSHNLRLWSSLEEILRKFREAGVDAIPLKGVFLSESLHKDIGLRPSTDIDLLVRREDLGRVRNELVRMGYAPWTKPHSPQFVENLLRHQGFFKTTSGNSGVYLEIHWNVYTRKPKDFDMSRMWANAAKRRVADLECLTLSPSDTLLHLAINLRLHGYVELKLLGDLHQVVKRHGDEIDWGYVVEEADKNGQRTGVYYALFLAKELLGSPIPEQALKGLVPPLLKRGLISLLLHRKRLLHPPSRGRRILYWDIVRLITIDSLRDAARTLAELMVFYPREIAIRHKSL